MDTISKPQPPSRQASSGPARFAKACALCRRHKLKCDPGRTGTYPCKRCEDTYAECVLVERERAAPTPSLSSMVSRQQSTLSGLADRVQSLQAQLASLSDLPGRMAWLEQRYNALLVRSNISGSESTPPFVNPTSVQQQFNHVQGDMQPPSGSSYGPSPSPLRTTSSLRDVRPIEPSRAGSMYGEGDRLTPQESKERETRNVVHDFDEADMNNTRVLADVRVFHPQSRDDRPEKRRRVEDEHDALARAFRLFTHNCLPAINFLDPEDPEINMSDMRVNSLLLFWAIIAVGSRETEEMHELYLAAQDNTMELLRQTLGGPKPTYWDLCGMMVWNKWLAPVRPIGHVVDMAYELDIHRTYELLRDKSKPTTEDVKRVRLWIAICIQDYFLSVSTGRPPHYPHRSLVLEQAKWIVRLPEMKRNDYRLLATYEYEEIAHSIQIELIRTGSLSDDWENEVKTRIADIDEWYARWEPIALMKSEPHELCSMIKSVRINYHLAKLSVYSVVLRGVRTTQDLTEQRLHYVSLSVEAARDNCHLCVADFQGPAIQYLGESQVYAFVSAAVFLLKVILLLPTMYDTRQIFADVEAVVETFKGVSGQRHAHFLAQILEHVRTHLRGVQASRQASRQASPSRFDRSVPPSPLPFSFFGGGPTAMVDHRKTMASNGEMVEAVGSHIQALEQENPASHIFELNNFGSLFQSDDFFFPEVFDTLETFNSSAAMGGM